MTTVQLRERIADLSTDDKYELIDVIWESIASEGGLTDAHLAELDRRLDTYERDPSQVIPWEQIEQEIDNEQ
jgi:putative addiction module component (TIGR02574 family)